MKFQNTHNEIHFSKMYIFFSTGGEGDGGVKYQQIVTVGKTNANSVNSSVENSLSVTSCMLNVCKFLIIY